MDISQRSKEDKRRCMDFLEEDDSVDDAGDLLLVLPARIGVDEPVVEAGMDIVGGPGPPSPIFFFFY